MWSEGIHFNTHPYGFDQPIIIHHYHHGHGAQENEDEGEEAYESPNCLTWTIVLFGVACTFYKTYCFFQNKARQWCVNARYLVENV